jgi:heptosyltransferase II
MSAIQSPSITPERVLVVRLCNWIGDVILSLPTLELLTAQGYSLRLYGKAWAPSLLEAYPWPVTVRTGSLSERVQQLKLIKPPKKRSLALAMPNSLSSALELKLAGYAVSGYARDGRSLLLSRKLKPSKAPHALEQFWTMAQQLSTSAEAQALRPPAHIGFKVSEKAQQRAQALIQAHRLETGYVCLVPFATGTMRKQSKVWPHFATMAQRLAAGGERLIVCPGPGEESICTDQFPQALRLDKIDLGTYAALMAGSKLVIANDTGPGHMAAAIGAPLLSLLGPTVPEEWGAWGPQVQRLGGHMNWPTLTEVETQVQQMLQAHRS